MRIDFLFNKSRLAWTGVVSAVLAAIFALAVGAGRQPFAFEVTLRLSGSGVAMIYYDIGRGINPLDFVRVPTLGGDLARRYRFPLPAGDYQGVRFDPTKLGGARVTLSDARIVDRAGQAVREFPATAFKPAQEFTLEASNESEATFTTPPGSTDPILAVETGGPFTLHASPGLAVREKVKDFLFAWVLFLSFGTFILLAARVLQAGWKPAAAWAERRPRLAVLTVAVASAVLSCYPVVFFGKSFVSPNILGSAMLYPAPPCLPGYDNTEVEDPKGSDYAAMLWQNLPYSFVQSRALWHDGELPLWNRYDSAGITLLGQGLSMFGDPLHTLVLAAGGAAWAWDVKFLLAKTLFCWGLGLAVLLAARHLPSALLLAFSAAFLGFFSYRLEHPAYFSMCYAPWLLVAWLEITRARTRRATAAWAGGLVLASWAELNSGTAKEAYMLLASLHGCGLLIFLLAGGKGGRLWKFPHLLCAGAVFPLLSAPVWLTFLDALGQSFTAYNETPAWQIQPGLLLGLFDDIFYRTLNPGGDVFDPSANFFILLGCLLAVARFKTLLREPVCAALGLGGMAAFALAFGVVPPGWIDHVPVLRNVGHVDNTFSCALIILSIVLAGFGLRSGWARLDRRAGRTDLLVVALALAGLGSLYLGLTHARQRPPDTFAPLGADVPRALFPTLYSASLFVALLALPWLGRLWRRRPALAPWAATLMWLCFFALHWRLGMHLKTGVGPIDDAVVNPQVRVNLAARSDTVDFLKTHAYAWRAVGFDGTFNTGYNALSGVESIYGTDALINPYYRELLSASEVTLVWTWLWVVEKDKLPVTLPLLDLLNVRYFLDAPQPAAAAPPVPPLDRVTRLDLNVYENHAAWPRAFFVERVATYDAVEEFVAAVRASAGQPLAAVQNGDAAALAQAADFTAAAAAPPATTADSPSNVASARDYRLTNNTTTFTIDAPGAGVAVLTEAYTAGDFRVRVNGEPADYFRVNHAFRGVRLPRAGTYTISFSYWPRHFTLSLWMCAAGGALLAGWACVGLRSPAASAIASPHG